MFYLSLVNALGEDQALNYFNDFSKNIISYTSSGSGPVNTLVAREAAVGFGMISQAVDQINKGNDELEVLFFEEGAPYSLYGSAIVKGKESKPGVIDIFDYIYYSYIEESCSKYYPEKIFKDKNFSLNNFPKNITYANMNNNTLQRKENLLKKWKF